MKNFLGLAEILQFTGDLKQIGSINRGTRSAKAGLISRIILPAPGIFSVDGSPKLLQKKAVKNVQGEDLKTGCFSYINTFP